MKRSRKHKWLRYNVHQLLRSLETPLTSLGKHSHLGVTVHYIDELWVLHSHALTVMKTKDRHFAETCLVCMLHSSGTFPIKSAHLARIVQEIRLLMGDICRSNASPASHTLSSALSQCLCRTVCLTVSWPNAEKLSTTSNTVQHVLLN